MPAGGAGSGRTAADLLGSVHLPDPDAGTVVLLPQNVRLAVAVEIVLDRHRAGDGWRSGIAVERKAQRRRADVAGQVGLDCGKDVCATGKPGRREVPGTRAVGRRRAEGGAAFLDCPDRVGLT